jgi:peptidyl-prolyl cis-trans isomerase C
VKTQFGWHVIKMEDKRQKQAPAFEAVKPQIESFLVRKAQNELVGQLRQAAKVERLDASGKVIPAPAPAPASPAPPAAPAEQPKQ